MRRLSLLLLGVLAGGGLVYSAFNYHLVRASDEWLVVKKQKVAIADFYVDVRRWSFHEWRGHPELMQALMQQGRTDLFLPAGSRDLFRGFQQKVGSALEELDTLRE